MKSIIKQIKSLRKCIYCSSNIQQDFETLINYNCINCEENFTIYNNYCVYIDCEDLKLWFNIDDQKLMIRHIMDSEWYSISYFEPDFSDKDKLCNLLNNKLKIIMAFQ